jgi:predicted amidohydrolase
VVLRYRKVNNWIPTETFASPDLIADYDEELFPVADTPLGVLGCLTCYDAIFPETYRELAMKGAKVVLLANAYPSPWQAEPPTNWLTVVPQVRSLENCVYTVNVNQGGDLSPLQFNGGSAIFDWEGRILAQTLQRGEQYVLGHVDLAGLRAWRASSYQHLGPAHLRAGAYGYLTRAAFPGRRLGPGEAVTQGRLRGLIDEGRDRWLEP